MITNFSPCSGSYVLNQFPSIVMFGMKGFHVSASGPIQGHDGRLVPLPTVFSKDLYCRHVKTRERVKVKKLFAFADSVG